LSHFGGVPNLQGDLYWCLKLFLDQFATGSLKGVVAFPLMLGGALVYSLAPEVLLKPVLVELGASCPLPALYRLENDFEDPPGLDEWVEEAKRFLAQLRQRSPRPTREHIRGPIA
jgi:FMN reductase